MGILYVTGIGIAVLIEVLLLAKRNKSASDRILSLWMAVVVVHLFLFYLYYTGEVFRFPLLLGTEIPLPLLHGVFLYLYVSTLTKRWLAGKYTVLHFAPAFLMYLYLISFFILPDDQKLSVYRNQGAGYETFNTIRHYAVLSSGIFYVALSLGILRKHRNAIQDQFSDLERVNLRWLQILTYGLGGIWLLLILFQNDTLVFTGVACFIFTIGFFGVRQGSIFVDLTPGPVDADNEQKEKYRKSGLSEDASRELHESLRRLMNVEKPYRSNGLSIDDLALKLGVHPNYLSQVINQRENKHFYDFVNSYRIEEFKQMIADQKNQQFTLLSLALDCGFSSKTSFNGCFKKATGQTPSEYVESISTPK